MDADKNTQAGAVGRLFCEFAIKKGHKLSLFVRSPGKIPGEIRHQKETHVIEGSLEDEASLEEASKCGANVFVSFAGPPIGSQGTVGHRSLLQPLN